jgi:hypothetical protein
MIRKLYQESHNLERYPATPQTAMNASALSSTMSRSYHLVPVTDGELPILRQLFQLLLNWKLARLYVVKILVMSPELHNTDVVIQCRYQNDLHSTRFVTLSIHSPNSSHPNLPPQPIDI